MPLVSMMVILESSQWLGKNIVQIIGKKKTPGKHDRFTGSSDIPEIILKMTLNTIISINQSLACIH